MADKPVTIGICAGEASGDTLGAGLIRALRQHYPNLIVRGLGGPKMIAQGCDSWFPMERLSVMGFVEPLKRLPELFRIRDTLRDRFIADPPDVFIGIDSPDFNLRLALPLRQAGIKTVHYVSPSVWAWRQKRIVKIARAVDLMLALFPFEEAFYREHQVPVRCVGHPLADEFAMAPDVLAARRQLGLSAQDKVLAVLPGSRGGEVERLAADFIATAEWCRGRLEDLKVVIPAANPARKAQLLAIAGDTFQHPDYRLLDGQSQLAMTAADTVLMASGTTTLEAMLLKKPMVVAYRLAWITYQIASRMVKLDHFSLPNLLAGRALVPEVLQDEVRADVLGPLVLERLQNPALREQLIDTFTAIHGDLRRNASASAAAAVAALIENHD